jgi:hypothetical protein
VRIVDDFGICGPDRWQSRPRAPQPRVAQQESKVTRIIVLAGQKGNGKDTAAEALYACDFRRAPLAGILKAMLKTMITAQGLDAGTADRMVDGDLKEVASQVLNGQTPRVAMQTLGTEWGRGCLSDTIWLDAWRRRWGPMIEGLKVDLVVTDCRFANEAEYLKKMGAEIFVVRRPGFQKPATHASEDLAWAEGYPIIWNDSDIPALHKAVLEAVKP